MLDNLDASLIKLNNQISNFTLKSPSIVNRKYAPNIDLIFSNWMNKFCNVYHQLVTEFNSSQIIVKTHNNGLNNNNQNKLFILIKNLSENGILGYNNSNEKIPIVLLSDLIKSIKRKDASKSLGEWFNKYNELIYYPDKKNMSFIQYLELYKNNNSNKKITDLINQIIIELEKYNMFTSYNIQNELQNGFKYEYLYSDKELEFKIYSNKSISLENDYWRFLYARMKCISRLYEKGNQQIKFKILLTNQLKKMPRKNKLFGPEEVNSGSTDYQEISIWRNEEHFKVILHESIHFFNLDGSYDLSSQNNKIDLKCHFQIEDDVKTRIYEAYTESIAVFFNSFANSYQIYYLNNKKDIINNLNLAYLLPKELKTIENIRKNLWIQEKKFFLLQISKIFIHINPESNNFQDFLINLDKCQETRLNTKYKLTQTTSLLSYHIIKGANIIFDQEFLEWLKNPFDTHPKSLFKFANYILEKTHSQTFIKLVNQAINFLKNDTHNFSKTLRMTSYEHKFF
jgi:hypothetical protein